MPAIPGFTPGVIELISARYTLQNDQPRNVKNRLAKLIPKGTLTAPVTVQVTEALSDAALDGGNVTRGAAAVATTKKNGVIIGVAEEVVQAPQPNMLTVEYTYNGQRLKKQAAEGTLLVLPRGCPAVRLFFPLRRHVGFAVVGAADHALHGFELVVHGVVQGVAAGLGGIQGATGEGGDFFHRRCGCGLGGGIERVFDEPDAAAEGDEDEEKGGAGGGGITHNACLNGGACVKIAVSKAKNGVTSCLA